MIENYTEKAQLVSISEGNQGLVNSLLVVKDKIEKQMTDFTNLLSKFHKTNLLDDKAIKELREVFLKDISSNVQLYDKSRDDLFMKLNKHLPDELKETFFIDKKAIFKGLDQLSLISDSAKIKRSQLEKYISDNGLAIFPYELLKDDCINEEVKGVVNIAKNKNPNKKAYIIGTINNIDIMKFLNGRKLDIGECIFSQNDSMIVQSFMFQLPLLQSLNEEIRAIKGDLNKVKVKINELKDTFESFVNQQISFNKYISGKVEDCIRDLNYLNEVDFNRREDLRIKNPYMWVIDYDTLVETEIVVGYRENYFGDNDDAIYEKIYVHPHKEILKPKSEQRYIRHIQTNEFKAKKIEDLTFDSVREVVREDLKNNFACILAKDINSVSENAEVIFTFGKGYEPVTSLTLDGELISSYVEAVKSEVKTRKKRV